MSHLVDVGKECGSGKITNAKEDVPFQEGNAN